MSIPRRLRLVVALAFGVLGCEPGEPARSPSADAPSKPLPLDPMVTKGVLENGLTYYVLPNRSPAKRAQMWLAVNAGSVIEDDDQRGLAHFVEHMAFNGTRRFPKKDIIEFLERSGMRFGADLNASTSFDETIYKVQVPTDRPELITRGLMVLRDFADGVTFDRTEVEKERGVVLEEWRLRLGTDKRLADKQEAETAHASRYLTHTPIGKAEVIKSAPAATLTRYYHDWYRPDLMAVIVVGDVSAADIVVRVKAEFGALKNPENERRRVTPPVGFGKTMAVSIETDPEIPQARVEIASPRAHLPYRNTRDFRRAVVEQLWNRMLSARLDEIARRPDAAFLTVAATTTHPSRPVDVFRQSAVVRQDSVSDGLAGLFREVIRVDRGGFTASELERAKTQVLRVTERGVIQSDARSSLALVAQLVRNFTDGESFLSPTAELALARELLPQLGIAEVNKVGVGLANGRLVSIVGPPSIAKPSAEAVRSTLRGILTSPLPPYEDVGSQAALLAERPAPGPVVETKTIRELGVTEWTLKNGARVVVKPTHLSSDTVRLSAFSPGGTSLASDADFDSARFAGDIVVGGGLGALDVNMLRKSLAGKIVGTSVEIGELQVGVSGTSSADDLETMLQLVNLSFVGPRRDPSWFQTWRARRLEALKSRQLSPDGAFNEEMAVFATQNHLRRRPALEDAFRHADLDTALAFYKDRFADAAGFTFVFVGNLDLRQLQPLVETYLGSLPSRGRKETWRDVGVTMPPGVATKTVVNGAEPKSRVTLTFHGDETWSRQANDDLLFLADVLGIRLREVLREDMGGVYSANVAGAIARRPRQEYTVNVTFGCAPENVNRLVSAVLDEARRLQEHGIAEDYLGRVREIRRRWLETAERDDTYWLRQLELAYVYGEDLPARGGAADVPMTAERLRAAAAKYLNTRQYLLGVLRPRTR